MLYENILRRLQAEIDEKIELAVREQLKKMAQMQAQMALQISNIVSKMNMSPQKQIVIPEQKIKLQLNEKVSSQQQQQQTQKQAISREINSSMDSNLKSMRINDKQSVMYVRQSSDLIQLKKTLEKSHLETQSEKKKSTFTSLKLSAQKYTP